MHSPVIRVIIPALNEEKSIAKVIKAIPLNYVEEVIVCDNGSTDKTCLFAEEAGATTLKQPQPGYGNACLKGIDYIKSLNTSTDIVVFLDGDHSDFPEEISTVVDPIIHEDYDMVIGSRELGKREAGSMTIPQVFGNALATFLIKLLFGANFTDLGPFRAIKYEKLIALEMRDRNYGWTVEMQVKAAQRKYKCTEVPVSYRKRIGKSKVSGTIKGTVLAGYKILWTIFKSL